MSCKEDVPKNFVKLSGSIENQNSDSLIVRQRTFNKIIKVNNDGTFSDTLKVETGKYGLFDGTKNFVLYLKNGFDLQMTLDMKESDEIIKFEGSGAEENNYLVELTQLNKNNNLFEIMEMDQVGFDKKSNTIIKDQKSLLDRTSGLDSTFIASEEKEMKILQQQMLNMYENKQALKVLKGQPSPKFLDYKNYAGGLISLDDLKGKYVYIDVWATWCGPCKKEIPFLKEVEAAYHGKNIEFVSISIDKNKDFDKWKSMVAEKELSGLQLIADNDYNSSFMREYKIMAIPRFILIDPDGNIVSADAPKPSEEKLIALFNELGI